MPKGRVINSNGGNYIVLSENNEEVSCKASGRLRYVSVEEKSSFNYSKNKNSRKTDNKRIKISPKVGDYVIYDNNYIIEVLERKNELIRPDISNVDQILLVFAAKEPNFSNLLLDMFLVNLEHANITPLIIISKMDLLTDDEYVSLNLEMDYYRNLGYNVVMVNSHNLVNREEIASLLHDKVSVVSGQTGAGKSSLINALIPGFKLNTQEISKALGRGKHTTRETTLYRYYGGLIGDTPGFSKLDLSDINPTELKDYFVEFKNYSCKFNDCLHTKGTKGCKVCEAVEKKEIKESRYFNYLRLLNDIKEGIKL
ncbi:MAG: ribosome small subunit-dependent GTPase A [Anaeroplasmataceae bacterium]